MKPPFLNNEGVFDAVFPLVDSPTVRTLHSKIALTPLQNERDHVVSLGMGCGSVTANASGRLGQSGFSTRRSSRSKLPLVRSRLGLARAKAIVLASTLDW